MFLFQAEDGIRDGHVTGVQTCALPISPAGTTSMPPHRRRRSAARTTSPTVPSDASPGGAVVGPATTPLTPQAPRLALALRTRRAIWVRPRPLRPSPRGRRRPPLPPVRARAGGGAPLAAPPSGAARRPQVRSEERRVGKGCRARSARAVES